MRYIIILLLVLTEYSFALTPNEIEAHYDSIFVDDIEGIQRAIDNYARTKDVADGYHKKYVHQIVLSKWAKLLSVSSSIDYNDLVEKSDGRLPVDEILIYDESVNCSIKLIYWVKKDKDVAQFMYMQCVDRFAVIPKIKKTR